LQPKYIAKVNTMTASNFAPALALVLSFEGGFSNDPSDPGGATCYGVTLDTLSAWRGRSCTVAEVRELTRADVQPIYAARFWGPVRGDDLPAGVDLITFDCAVNQGPGTAARMLQRAAGVVVDGQLGPVTLRAVQALPAAQVIAAMRVERDAAYRAASGFPRYGAGWLRRLHNISCTGSAWAAKSAVPAAQPSPAPVEVDL
jgi:lysozyme family protein